MELRRDRKEPGSVSSPGPCRMPGNDRQHFPQTRPNTFLDKLIKLMC